MEHMKKLLAAIPFVLLQVAFASTPDQPGQNGDDTTIPVTASSVESSPAYTHEQAERVVAEMIPLVEKLTGRTFKEAPRWEIADQSKVAEVLADDLLPQFRNLMPDAAPEAVESAAQQQSRVLVTTFLGKYGVASKTLYLLPENVEPLFQATGVDTKLTHDILKLVVAHELTHALQAQHAKIMELLLSESSVDRLQAINATMEGFAVFVQDRVGEQLGVDEAAMEFARMLSAGAVEMNDPAIAILHKTLSKQFEQIYIGGRNFIAYHHEHGGWEKLWELMDRPPATTAMIANPTTYAPTAAAHVDLSPVFEGLEEWFGDRDWTIQNRELGSMLLRSAYASLPAAEVEEILANIEHVHAFVTQAGPPVVVASATLYTLKDERFVPTYLSYLAKAAQANVDAIRAAGGPYNAAIEITDFQGVKADASQRVIVTVEKPSGDIAKTLIVRVARGRTLLELVVAHFDLDNERMVAMIEEIFKRYDQLVQPVAETQP